MARKPKLRCWYVCSWDEEKAEIVWSTSHTSARREGAAAIDEPWRECRANRMPELDNFSGNLDVWKREHGWWTTCMGCGERIPWGDECCSPECQRKHEAELEQDRSNHAKTMLLAAQKHSQAETIRYWGWNQYGLLADVDGVVDFVGGPEDVEQAEEVGRGG